MLNGELLKKLNFKITVVDATQLNGVVVAIDLLGRVAKTSHGSNHGADSVGCGRAAAGSDGGPGVSGVV